MQETKQLNDKPNTMIIKCDNCECYTKNFKIVFYDQKKSKDPENWCMDCINNEVDDLCVYCGANSYGVSPCNDCKYNYMED